MAVGPWLFSFFSFCDLLPCFFVTCVILYQLPAGTQFTFVILCMPPTAFRYVMSHAAYPVPTATLTYSFLLSITRASASISARPYRYRVNSCLSLSFPLGRSRRWRWHFVGILLLGAMTPSMPQDHWWSLTFSFVRLLFGRGVGLCLAVAGPGSDAVGATRPLLGFNFWLHDFDPVVVATAN